MHLICLGVVKKMIILWMKGSYSVRLIKVLLNTISIIKLSHLLMLLKNIMPNDFVRKPRSIKEVKHWKAVEFKTFLLYTDPIVLKRVLKREIYIHFLTLHVVITIVIRQNLLRINILRIYILRSK